MGAEEAGWRQLPTGEQQEIKRILTLLRLRVFLAKSRTLVYNVLLDIYL